MKMKSKKVEIEIDFLGGDKNVKFMNDMMHAGDVFEKGKQFAVHNRFVLTGTITQNLFGPEDEELNNVCSKLANASIKSGGYAVFVGIRSVNGKRVEPRAWFMPEIQSISMYQGENLGWALFKDILSHLEYNVKTDQYMRVISVQQ